MRWVRPEATADSSPNITPRAPHSTRRTVVPSQATNDSGVTHPVSEVGEPRMADTYDTTWSGSVPIRACPSAVGVSTNSSTPKGGGIVVVGGTVVVVVVVLVGATVMALVDGAAAMVVSPAGTDAEVAVESTTAGAVVLAASSSAPR